jgi:signal peptidase II
MADVWRQIAQRFAATPWPRLGLSLAALVFVLDQLTKWVVLNPLNFSPAGCLEYQTANGEDRFNLLNTCGQMDVLPFFDLAMVWNDGVSFGLFGASELWGRVVLILFSVLISTYLMAGLLGWGAFFVVRRMQAISYGMVIGGALGNVVDRASYGAVVDFLHLKINLFDYQLEFDALGRHFFLIDFADMFPFVFNVADMGVVFGVTILIIDMLLNDQEPAVDKE